MRQKQEEEISEEAVRGDRDWGLCGRGWRGGKGQGGVGVFQKQGLHAGVGVDCRNTGGDWMHTDCSHEWPETMVAE